MKSTQVKRGRPSGKAKTKKTQGIGQSVMDEFGKHGPLFEKNVRFHDKNGSICLVTYSKCKDKPIDIKTYVDRE